jgi:D-glycero-D-manno-heptose 1,7-bisphosphate phosphatase
MKVIFLDRDGVINRYPGDGDYVKSLKEFFLLPKSAEGVRELNRSGYRVYVISNQAGVGKGTYSKSALDLITGSMISKLKKKGAFLSGVNYCLHRKEEECPCRKPKTGLIERVIKSIFREGINVDRKQSYFIGDTIIDVLAGKKAGLKTILVFSGKEKPGNSGLWETRPDFTAQNLFEAVKIILSKK